MNPHIKNKESASIAGVLTITKLKNGKKIWESEPMHNKVVSSDGYGRNLLMRKLAGVDTYPVEIDSFSIGDGTTAPVDADTGLENSLVSGIDLTNVSLSNNVLTIDVFISDDNLPDDTYAEVGFFCTGRIFSRILLTAPYTKSTGEDTLFSYTLTFTG